MYTGIIKGLGEVIELEKKTGLTSFGVRFPSELLPRLEHGASVSLDGVCLTVVRQVDSVVFFDAMEETLNKTTLGNLQIGRRLNLERSATSGVEVGGHIVSGHVDGLATILSKDTPENNVVLTFQVPTELARYIFTKGFIALDGASLTVVDANPTTNSFKIWFIPETLRATNFGQKKVGDQVNVEIEFQTKVLVDTVERLLPGLVGKLSGAK